MNDKPSTKEHSVNNEPSTSHPICEYCHQQHAPVATCVLYSGPTVELCTSCMLELSTALALYPATG